MLPASENLEELLWKDGEVRDDILGLLSVHVVEPMRAEFVSELRERIGRWESLKRSRHAIAEMVLAEVEGIGRDSAVSWQSALANFVEGRDRIERREKQDQLDVQYVKYKLEGTIAQLTDGIKRRDQTDRITNFILLTIALVIFFYMTQSLESELKTLQSNVQILQDQVKKIAK
jgi:hypothetical protein